MPIRYPLRVGLDTNVVFEGLTKSGGACGLIVDLWQAHLIRACVSDTLVYEYGDVLSRKLSQYRWDETKLLLETLLSEQTEFVGVYFSWRPISSDPGDDHVINCAMNANAPIVTSNVRDFRQAKRSLGLQIITPTAFLNALVRS